IFAEAMTDGSEEGLLAGARKTLADQVADFLMNEGAEPKQFASLATTLSMLSSSNQGERGLRARLAKLEAEQAERKAAAERMEEKKKAVVAKGGLSEEAIALMEETLKILS